MDLAEKLKDLRYHAGMRRKLGRALTQAEVAHAIHTESGGTMSQGYLSQLERGRRVHLTAHTREQLARFFGVHPGYLVSDPEQAESLAPVAQVKEQQHAYHTGLHLHHQHPLAHRTLARLAINPRRQQLWPLLDQLIDLSEDDFHDIRHWVADRSLQAAPQSSPAARHGERI